jgi:chemotaxis protein methyltransferase CheR
MNTSSQNIHNDKLSEKDFRRVSNVIYKHCGINLHGGKEPLVRARLAKRMRILKFDSFRKYVDFALSDAGKHEFHSLVDSLSTNLTSFFREKDHFQYLINPFLPKLLEKKSGLSEHKIRIWSAGCSSGEEPYSLAITLIESIPDYQKWDVKILASDISTQILDRAKQGTYDQSRVKPLTKEQKRRFLIPNNIEGEKVYQVSRELQNIICFRYLNLMNEWPCKGPFDIIFCRNVMIYFDKPTQARLIERFGQCLAKGGVLCIGHSESLSGINHKYRFVQPATYIKE